MRRRTTTTKKDSLLTKTWQKLKNIVLPGTDLWADPQVVPFERFYLFFSFWWFLRPISSGNFRFWGGGSGYFFFNSLQRLPWASEWLCKPYKIIILIIWDILETYSRPSSRWKLFFEIELLNTVVWNLVKIQFLAYCAFIKVFSTFLCLETKSLHTCSQSIWQLYSRSSSSFERRWFWRLWNFKKV